MITISHAYSTWMDARHAANEAADDQGAALIIDDGDFYRVFSGETIEECNKETWGHVVMGSVIQGQRL